MAFDPQDAVEYLRLVADAESVNRAEGLEDLRFSYGEQWPVEIQNARTLESRPCLTINKVDSYIRQVTNNQRQQRPRMKAHPMDSIADPKIAEVLTGIFRHIEENSDADNAYDNAFNSACRMGWGYWRVVTDYISEQTFDQDIYIQQVENPFSVYFDPNSTLPDGSDAEKCLVTDLMTRDAFKKAYPGAEVGSFQARATGDATAEWITKEDIRIAEYFEVEKQKQKLVMLSDKSIVWADKLPKDGALAQMGLTVTGDRESYRRVVKWRKCTAFDVLDEQVWPGRYIPIVPCYGDMMIIDGKRRKFGLTRFARDPQMMYNFWRTAMTESIAMAPKAKWLMAEGQDEGHENEWNKANVSAMAVLRYKMSDIEGKDAGKPERIQPEPPPTGMMEAASAISSDLQSVLGIFDPETNAGQGPKSGRAIRAEMSQSEQSNFHYFDNLTRTIKHTGRIILDLVPHIYDTERVMRIIGDDGKPDLITINEQDRQEGIDHVLNDVTVGTYDVVMDTGPGFNSKRQEALEAFTSLMGGPLGEEIAKVGGDLIVRLYDAPGMDALADRLASLNPASQIDENSDVPPQAQMMIKNLQDQVQKQQQIIQQGEQLLKSRADIKQMEETAETKRELMRVTAKAHDIQMRDDTKRHDTEVVMHTKANDVALGYKKAMDVEELKGKIALLLAQFGEGHEAEDNAIDSAI